MSELMVLGKAVAADMAARRETVDQYAQRRGISRAAIEAMLDCGNSSAIAKLLAQEITARLGAGPGADEPAVVAIRCIDLSRQPLQLTERDLPF